MNLLHALLSMLVYANFQPWRFSFVQTPHVVKSMVGLTAAFANSANLLISSSVVLIPSYRLILLGLQAVFSITHIIFKLDPIYRPLYTIPMTDNELLLIVIFGVMIVAGAIATYLDAKRPHPSIEQEIRESWKKFKDNHRNQ